MSIIINHVKASMVLTRTDNVCIYNYVRYTSKYYSENYCNGPDAS